MGYPSLFLTSNASVFLRFGKSLFYFLVATTESRVLLQVSATSSTASSAAISATLPPKRLLLIRPLVQDFCLKRNFGLVFQILFPFPFLHIPFFHFPLITPTPPKVFVKIFGMWPIHHFIIYNLYDVSE